MIAYLWEWILTFVMPKAAFRHFLLNRFYELKEDKEQQFVELDIECCWIVDKDGLLWKGTNSVQ